MTGAQLIAAWYFAGLLLGLLLCVWHQAIPTGEA